MAKAIACLSDIERLTEETSSARRRELLDAVTDIFLVTADYQTDSDAEMLSEIMERIAYALEIEARAQLAERVSRASRASRGLVVRLANDEISVARPVLEQSPVLTNTDLIDVIHHRSQDHIYSIAGRESIAEPVADEIIERGDERTLARLTGNRGAEITEPGFGKLAARAKECPELMEALSGRADLPEAIIRTVKSKLGGRLKSEIARTKPEVDDKFVASLIDRCAETIKLDYSPQSVAELERLHKTGAITENVIVGFARQKRIPELVYSLSLLTGIDDWSMSQCLLRAELPALAILCKAHSLKSSTFLALAETRTGSAAVPSSAMARAMREYETLSIATAERVMRYLKLRLDLMQKKAKPLSDDSAAA